MRRWLKCSSRPEPTSRPTLLERLPCVGQPEKGHEKMVEVLLKAGADIEAKDKDG